MFFDDALKCKFKYGMYFQDVEEGYFRYKNDRSEKI